MDDVLAGVLIIVWLAVSTVATIAFWLGGTLDARVVSACETRGYWQTGQTRVLCSVEGAKK